MKIIKVNIADLKPYEKNAKKHPKKQVEQIANSIVEFGMCDPIAVWGDDNIIIEGHGRLLALKKLGYDEAPVIRLDHLTDEQRKAYTLAHNKVAESEWEFDLLDDELNDILDIDMEQFGFEFVDTEKNKERTQQRVENIHNLDKQSFEGVGQYDIPQLHPVYEMPEVKEWIGFNYVLSDKEPEGKGVHFFVDDYQFNRVWNNPEKYVEKLKRYACVLTPDFSPYSDMPMATQIFNHYRKHWCGAYWQSHGITVIPTIRASTDERSLEWYLDGEPKGGIVAISSMWTATDEARAYFVDKEYKQMFKTLKPSKVLLYGKMIDGLKGNIEVIESFSRKRFK